MLPSTFQALWLLFKVFQEFISSNIWIKYLSSLWKKRQVGLLYHGKSVNRIPVDTEFQWIPHINGPILSKFPAPVQLQCNPRVREQMFLYLEKAFLTASPPQDAVCTPLAWLHQNIEKLDRIGPSICGTQNTSGCDWNSLAQIRSDSWIQDVIWGTQAP